MAIIKIHKIITKYPDSVFLDGDAFTEEQDAVWQAYVDNFTSTLNGYMPNTSVSVPIDENSMMITIRLKAPEGKEQLYAENYMREIGLSENEYKKAYLKMRYDMGERVDGSKTFWRVEYANNHIQEYKFGQYRN
jgi:hypothetical protein